MRVGEASHPGPVQTRHARRLQSTLVDSDEIDLEDDIPMICGRLSASSGAIPHVHGSHVRTAEDSVRVASPPVPSSSAQGREGVPRKRLRLCQTSTTINSSVLDALEEDLHGASSSVIPRAARSSQDDFHVDRHAILSADGQDDLPMTWPSSSGQVRALHEEEGRSISLVDSIRATHANSSSDRERVHTTQFDMTAGDTGSEIGPEVSIPDVLVEPHVPEIGDMDVFGSQSDTETVDAVSEVELADESPFVSDPDPVVGEVRESAVFREAFRSLDTVDIGRICSRRATVMRSSPQFLRGAYRSAIRVAMKEISHGVDDIDERRQIRGWKLFFLLPRLLLFRPHRGGNLPKKNLEERFRMFIEGRWVQLLIDSEACEAASSLATRRRRRNFSDTIDRRAERDGEPVAPGTQRTFDLLSDPERRPPEPYNPMPEFL